MTGVTGQGSVLSVAGHAGVDQAGVAFPQRLWTDAQAFGHAGPVHVDKGIGVGGEPMNEVPAARILHVGGQ